MINDGQKNGDKMTIKIKIKNIYGNETIYPACDTSQRLAELAGTRTLTRKALEIIKALGYEITIEQQTL